MKDFQKLLWSRNGSQVDISLNLQKIDATNRVIVGFATLDNVDFADDIVPLDAALKAFESFRGNVRFQHDAKKPVGRVIDFAPSSFYDEKTKETHQGIQVAVRISDGAEDVWKMCLDETLSGFSIGGSVKKAKKVWSTELKKNIQVIEEFMLTELSVVDSPMNGLANIIAIHKSLDYGTIEKDYDSFNLFWCGFDRIASQAHGQESNCPQCGEAMANMGHTEKNADIAKQLEKVFSNETEGGQPNMEKSTEDITVEKNIDGEDEVASVDEVSVEEVEPEVTEDEVVEEDAEDEAEDETDKVEDEVEAEVVTEEPEVEKSADATAELAGLVKALQEALTEKNEGIVKSHDELKDEFARISDEMTKKLEGISENYGTLEKSLEDLKSELKKTEDGLGDVTKRLDSVVESTAFKKSLDSSNRSEPKEDGSALFHKVFTL